MYRMSSPAHAAGSMVRRYIHDAALFRDNAGAKLSL
jgi:hypothetical protein